MCRATLLLVLAALAAADRGVAQAPPAPAKPQPAAQTVVTPAGEVRVLPDGEAAKLVARVQTAVLSPGARKEKPRKAGDKEAPVASWTTRLQEVEELGRVQHASLVPLLEKVMLGDPNDTVRIKAAESLLAQPGKPATALAIRLLKDRKFLERGALTAPLIKLCSHYGAPDDVWAQLYKRFLDLAVVAQQTLIESIGQRKDWNAVDLLLDHIDAPKPANVDDPNNPPEAYWKQRWEQWRGFTPQLQQACKTLFGRSFGSREEAQEWIQAQGGIAKLRQSR
jgi:hypothetical protein